MYYDGVRYSLSLSHVWLEPGSGNLGLGLDLDEVLVANQLGLDQRVRRLDLAEAGTVSPGGGLPVVDVANKDAGPDHVGELGPERLKT